MREREKKKRDEIDGKKKRTLAEMKKETKKW